MVYKSSDAYRTVMGTWHRDCEAHKTLISKNIRVENIKRKQNKEEFEDARTSIY
jgi:hypothetical protein